MCRPLPGPPSAGASQRPPRRRHRWRADSQRWSPASPWGLRTDEGTQQRQNKGIYRFVHFAVGRLANAVLESDPATGARSTEVFNLIQFYSLTLDLNAFALSLNMGLTVGEFLLLQGITAKKTYKADIHSGSEHRARSSSRAVTCRFTICLHSPSAQTCSRS